MYHKTVAFLSFSKSPETHTHRDIPTCMLLILEHIRIDKQTYEQVDRQTKQYTLPLKNEDSKTELCEEK